MSIRGEIGALPPALLAPFNSAPRLMTIAILVILFVLFRYSGGSDERLSSEHLSRGGPGENSLESSREIGVRKMGGKKIGGRDGVSQPMMDDSSILSGREGVREGTRRNEPQDEGSGRKKVVRKSKVINTASAGSKGKRPTLDFLIPENKDGTKRPKPQDDSPLLEIEKKLGLR